MILSGRGRCGAHVFEYAGLSLATRKVLGSFQVPGAKLDPRDFDS
jgi:hypothetical protein